MQSTPETNDLQGKSDEFIRAYDIFNAAMDRDFTSGAVEFSRKSKRDYAEAFALFTHCANQGDGRLCITSPSTIKSDFHHSRPTSICSLVGP